MIDDFGSCLNICFCADTNYLRFVVPAIESIEQADPGANYVYHVVSDLDAPDHIISLLDKVINVSSQLVWHRIATQNFDGLKEVLHFTKAMYYRLSIPHLIEADKVLYLDCDIFVRKSLGSLFEIDLKDNYIAGVFNPFFERHDLVDKSDYFNSGVMLINCEKWRTENVMERVLQALRNHPDKMLMPDQDALNLVFNGRWHRLDISYNAQMAMYEGIEHFSDCEFYLSDPVIIHFSATNKQWHHSCALRWSKEYRSLNTSKVIFKRNFFLDFVSRAWAVARYRVAKGNKYFSF